MLKEEKPMVYQASIYIRLSREDGDKFESNSVKNQRELIHAFLIDKDDIVVISEKVDDGFSGVTFERPALKEMLEEIKQGKVNCVIVKDLSRFGRNYIETGRYIQEIFPFLGVRFIAINDNIDTAREDTQTDSIVLPFKNLMNDAYSRDISIKARSQLEVRQKKGDFVGAFPVYGYTRSKEDKHKLVVDEMAAATVKEIFSLRISGYNNTFISDYLNQLGIPSPLEYKIYKNSKFMTSFKRNPQAKWSPMAVDRILKNEIYTGMMVQGKETTLNYKLHKRIKKPKQDWIRVESSHDAIITKGEFNIVQGMMLNDTRTSPQADKLYLLSGFLRCGTCGSNMVRKTVKARGKTYAYYVCSKNKEDSNQCSSHRIRESFVVDALEKLLESHVNMFGQLDKLETAGQICWWDKQENLAQQYEYNLERLKKYESLKKSLYEDYREGILTKAEFLEMKLHYEQICKAYRDKIKNLQGKKTTLLEAELCQGKCGQGQKKDNETPQLNRANLIFLVERIIVVNGSTIRVVLNYKDEFHRNDEGGNLVNQT
ncbi:recombinase family protein [Anaerotignum sp.]|uniref:recombinase family protein n=1 Tax=Anaerotignum sp. TaxID=2039241 RepID=UPI0028B11B46|nr:recombinase family protein [Anaerotignum sp.]